MQHPKVTVIGAGSYFFGKQVIWNMVKSPHLRKGTLALVDTDPEHLELMLLLAEKVKAATGAPLKVEGSVNRRDVLGGSDFVVLSFSTDNAYYRTTDTRISAKYGITMCSGDTIGPGGIFRALRELPEVIAIGQDAERLCPHAWLINFINPTTVMGIGLMRHVPKMRSFALCDGNHMPYFKYRYMKLAGVMEESADVPDPESAEKFRFKIAGVNHFTWMTECSYEGRDMMDAIGRTLARKAGEEFRRPPGIKSKPRFNWKYANALFRIYHAYPTAVSHTKEYLPFFQGHGVTPCEPEGIQLFDGYKRGEEMDRHWQSIRNLVDGVTPISEFLEMSHGDHATDIIESMVGNLGKRFYINTVNGGAVSNMPQDAFLELECEVDFENGPRPLPFGEMPRGLLGRQMQVLDTHELTVEAALTYDRRTLLKALCTDPMIVNIGDAENIMRELLEAEKEALPGWN